MGHCKSSARHKHISMHAMPTLSSPILTLQHLAAFDPRASGVTVGQDGGEHRFLCPLCGGEKPRDSVHRSLSLNVGTGIWHCHRCAQGGKLREAWDERPLPARRDRARAALAQTFAVAPSPAPELPKSDEWRKSLHNLEPPEGTRGMFYLRARGLSVEVAHQAGARFSRDFMGRPAVVFPLRDRDGVLRGAHARYVDGRDKPKARTLGDKRLALFATHNALNPELPALIVTEAPLDALSLAEAGYPAVALCGTDEPAWLHRICAFRRVLLAFDADEAGDRAGEKLAPMLGSFGAKCERLRPEGGKDWNEVLQNGRESLGDWLALRVLV